MDGKTVQGGASPHTGGRDERPPKVSRTGAAAPNDAKKRWIPPSSVKRDAPIPAEGKNDFTFRRVRGILNKLAPEKFDKLSLELLNVGIDSDVILKGIILLTFRRLLLNKCQDEFENRSKATEGELGKLEMLHEGILHKCIKQLLEKKKNVPVRDMAEDLECLCQIIRTVGRRLDTPKAKWVPRPVSSEHHGPKTITQIRQEAADEFGEYIPPQQSNRGYSGRSQMNGSMGTQWMSGGNMGDLFGGSPPGLMMGSIGTGPGVIQLDNFNYSTNMGKPRNNQQQGQGFVNFNKQRQDGGQRNQRGGHQNQMNQQNGRHSPPQNQQQQQQKQAAGGARDLPPRFARLAQQQQTQQSGSSNSSGVAIPSNEEISLRPAKNFNVFKPNTPSNLPKSAQGGPPINSMMKMNLGPPEPPKPLLNKQQPITIKQVSQEKKEKSNKKVIPTKEEVDKGTARMLSTYMEDGDTNEALNTFKDMNVPKRFVPELLTQMMTTTVDKTDKERESVMKLISAMKAEHLISSDQYIEAFQSLLDQMADLETDVPLIRSYVAKFAALGVTEGVVALAELAEPMENGAFYPLFLLCLQQIHKLKDKDWLVTSFNDSKVNLQMMLPEIDQNKEKMMEILEDRGLSFMFPLLRVQSELWKQIQAEPGANALFKWIKDKVDSSLHHTSGFIHILTTSLLKYCTYESTMGKGVDTTVTPEKTLQEKEKQAMEKMKGVLQMFVHEHMDLQIESLYAAQVFCHTHQFPKGMLLRFFMNFYDMEIIDEEIFLKWKEEVNDEYPGKGKALFQVNQWLTWLEQAEEESDEEED
ncbi:hypothetical protein KUTeg_022644 [Tegillarca granosa]|uniref:Eukaryotic translation initiation factor 4 gamma 2 n=1 Tax=Tegillarca granosa TaxID=220873 RepID=A0ABQ9DZT6_TEGGR|nr:hypothetical protein KUTeg_022644 [Tegillarca granosa]